MPKEDWILFAAYMLLFVLAVISELGGGRR